MMRLRRWHASAAHARAYAVRRRRSPRLLRGRRVRAASSDFTLLQRARAPGPQLSFHWTGEFAVALGDVRVALYQLRAQQQKVPVQAARAAHVRFAGLPQQQNAAQQLVLYKTVPAARTGIADSAPAEVAAQSHPRVQRVITHTTTRELVSQRVLVHTPVPRAARHPESARTQPTFVHVHGPAMLTRTQTFSRSATHTHSRVSERSFVLRSVDHIYHSLTQLRSVLQPLRLETFTSAPRATPRFSPVMQLQRPFEARAAVPTLVHARVTQSPQTTARAVAAFPSQSQPLVPVTAPKPQLDPPAIERITTTLQKTMAVAVEQSVHREIDRKMRAALGSRRFRTSIQADLCNEILFERERLGGH